MASVELPLVSVIIPAYNAEKWIAECVQSAIGQTYPDLEIIVVDDGSTDGTAKIIEDDFRGQVSLFQQQNRGQAAATFRGIKEARGEFIAFLDSDDLWKLEKIETQVAYLRANPDVVALHTDAEEFATFGVAHVSYLDRHSLLRCGNDPMAAIVACDIPLRSTMVLRNEFLTRHAISPDSQARSVDDVGLFMEIIGRGGRFDLLDEVTTYRRMHEANISSNHFNRFAWRVPMYERLLARCADCDEHWKAMVRRALSDAEFRIGEHHWGQGKQREARPHFRNAVKAWPGNSKAYRGLIYTLLPPSLAGLLRKAKRVCGKKLEGTTID